MNVNVAKHARDQCSIFSTVQQFHPDYGLLLELHALTLVARSYALLHVIMYMLEQTLDRLGTIPEWDSMIGGTPCCLPR